MKKIVWIVVVSLLLFNAPPIFGQKITFSPDILSTKDAEIAAIRDTWSSYIKDCVKSYKTKDRSFRLSYWNDLEKDNGFSDMLIDNMSAFPIYFYGELITFNIDTVENGFYRIRSMVIQSDSISKNVTGVFSLYAKKENSSYKFYNYFFLEKSHLNLFTTKHLDYYYPSDYAFDPKEAENAENFYSKLSDKYKCSFKNKLTYIIGNNLDDANRYIGFDFSQKRSSSKSAGYFCYSNNFILSCQVNHKHEIVHSIFITNYPSAPLLFQEGIATFYAGTIGKDYRSHLSLLSEIIKNSPNIDLSNFGELHKLTNNYTNPFYTIGAIFIEYALEIGGNDKVLALFNYSDTSEEIYKAIETELGIKKSQISSFLKDYVKRHNF